MKKQNSKRKKDQCGFTLIELLLSLAIITILTGASLSIVRFSDTQKNLVLSANQLRALIRSAQTYALAVPFSSKEHICGFGVYFEDNETAKLFYTTGSDFDNNPANACNNSYAASRDSRTEIIETIIFSASLSSGFRTVNDIFFRAPYGQVYSKGNLLLFKDKKEFTFTANGFNKNVTVYGTGRLE